LRTRRRISAFLDGALESRAAATTAAHLATCQRCGREADGLRRLRVVLQQAFVPAPAPDWAGFWAGVVRGIEDGRPRVAVVPRPGWRARPRLALGGALAVGAMISLTVWQLSSSPVPPAAGPVTVTAARTEFPGATLMVYSPPERDLALVWVFGVE
jgi:anti-sigma factor RsiW